MSTSIKNILIVLGCVIVIFCAVSSTMACSTVFITSDQGEQPAVVGRSMDNETDLGPLLGVGLKGDTNVSDVNMQDHVVQRAEWTNSHDVIGKIANNSIMFCEGINTAGVYIGALNFPGLTFFAEYDPDGKPALSHTDLVLYLLGTSSSVEGALENLGKVQVVVGAALLMGEYISMPWHFSIRDRSGKTAVLEYTKDGLMIYLNKLLSYEIDKETIEAETGGKIDQSYANAGKVLTNAPVYSWHNACYNKQDTYFHWSGDRTGRKWDGGYQNASGTYGLRGDWTAPSRFQRLMALLKPDIMPVPNTSEQAKFLAHGAINTVIQPAGVSICPTIWVTISDLQRGEYLYRRICILGSTNIENVTVIDIPYKDETFGFEKYNVNDVSEYLLLQKKNIQHIVCSFDGVVPEAQRSQALSGLAATEGATPNHTVFQGLASGSR